ncbi:hypothetical protein EVAR_43018_1 [Eumeta japonica]|uniref:Uncharacterized protein n=1 Tax=Eumeta variegata TaxID=151549 RepID=A0A4C1XLX0_EUMVA|nr:hypothetical protein EVAR_43018_1 [Eumeta japonica]
MSHGDLVAARSRVSPSRESRADRPWSPISISAPNHFLPARYIAKEFFGTVRRVRRRSIKIMCHTSTVPLEIFYADTESNLVSLAHVVKYNPRANLWRPSYTFLRSQ